MPEEIRKAHEAAWPDILAPTEKLLAEGVDPASDEAQAILLEWNAMTQIIYDIDPTLMRSAAKLYDNMDEWPDNGPEKPFSKEVWAFIQAAQSVADGRATAST